MVRSIVAFFVFVVSVTTFSGCDFRSREEKWSEGAKNPSACIINWSKGDVIIISDIDDMLQMTPRTALVIKGGMNNNKECFLKKDMGASAGGLLGLVAYQKREGVWYALKVSFPHRPDQGDVGVTTGKLQRIPRWLGPYWEKEGLRSAGNPY